MKCIVLAFLCVLSVLLASAAEASNQQEATRLLELALSRTNIFDLPSFRMEASVQIATTQDKLLDGNYQLFWNGPDQWKEEISFPGYTEVRVGGKGVVWIQRSTDHIPLRIHQLRSALGFGSGIGLTPKDTIKKASSRKKDGEKLTCIEIEHETAKSSSSVCINEGSGLLVRDPLSYSDADFQPVGEKIFPRSLSFIKDRKTKVKVSISELVTPAEFTASSFAPPTGVSPQAGCMHPNSGRLVNKVAPLYPTSARQQHIEGTVVVDAEIGSDGVPRLRKVIQDPDPSLVRSAVDALAEWRYEPATCGDKPVSVDTLLEVNYKLR